jgi:hypothetical protein
MDLNAEVFFNIAPQPPFLKDKADGPKPSLIPRIELQGLG